MKLSDFTRAEFQFDGSIFSKFSKSSPCSWLKVRLFIGELGGQLLNKFMNLLSSFFHVEQLVSRKLHVEVMAENFRGNKAASWPNCLQVVKVSEREAAASAAWRRQIHLMAMCNSPSFFFFISLLRIRHQNQISSNCPTSIFSSPSIPLFNSFNSFHNSNLQSKLELMLCFWVLTALLHWIWFLHLSNFQINNHITFGICETDPSLFWFSKNLLH